MQKRRLMTGLVLCLVLASCKREAAAFTDSEGVAERYQRAKTPASAPAESQPENPHARDSEAQKRTVADIRNVGTAMFSWLTDQVGAAAAGQPQMEGTSPVVHLQQYTPISHKELEKILVPLYLQKLPEKDGWGHAYEFYLDTANVTGPQTMSIRSPGRDGRFSANDYTVGSFQPTNFDEDIVWSEGFFVRWPQAPPSR